LDEDIALDNMTINFSKEINLRFIDKILGDVIHKVLMQEIFNVVQIELESNDLVDFDETTIIRDRIRYFMEFLDDLKEECDTIIGPDILGYGDYKDIYREFIKEKEFINIPGNKYLLAINSKKIYLKIVINKVELVKLEWHEITRKELIEKEEWEYPVYINIKLPFEKNELQEYIDGFIRKLTINFTVEIKKTDDPQI